MARLKIGFIPIEGGHFYKDALEEVIRGEELGFDSIWMTHLICRLFFPGMPHRHLLRELDLLSREVMPAFR